MLRPHSRNAVFALALAVVFAALLIPIGNYIQPRFNAEAGYALHTIGELAGIVFALWAALHAWRAMKAGEPTFIASLVIVFPALALGDYGMSLWEPQTAVAPEHVLFLPVLLPFYAGISLLSHALVKYSLWKPSAPAAVPLTHDQRWHRAMRAIKWTTPIAALVLLPIPIFILSSNWPGDVRAYIAEHTPSFICDASARLCRNNLREGILRNGNVSNEFLIEHLDNNSLARETLLRRAPSDKSLRSLLEAHLRSGSSTRVDALYILINSSNNPRHIVERQIAVQDLMTSTYLVSNSASYGLFLVPRLHYSQHHYAQWKALDSHNAPLRILALQNFYLPVDDIGITEAQSLQKMLDLLNLGDKTTSHHVARILVRDSFETGDWMRDLLNNETNRQVVARLWNYDPGDISGFLDSLREAIRNRLKTLQSEK